MKKSLIYTRTGDKGNTSLVGGERVSKTHVRLEAYGTIDELNSHLGVLTALTSDVEVQNIIRYVQHCLFTVGAYLATNQDYHKSAIDSCITKKPIKILEDEIDKLDATLPPLKAFILPGGSHSASYCHVCRTVCRRAERCIFALEEELQCQIDDTVKCFINRLSDYLFVLSRKLNQLAQQDDFFWDKSCK